MCTNWFTDRHFETQTDDKKMYCYTITFSYYVEATCFQSIFLNLEVCIQYLYFAQNTPPHCGNEMWVKQFVCNMNTMKYITGLHKLEGYKKYMHFASRMKNSIMCMYVQ